MKGKPKGPPIQEEATLATGKAESDTMPAEKDGGHSSDAISNEEMAAFDKIMDEIEDQEEKKISGATYDPETEESSEQAFPEGLELADGDRLETSDNEKGMDADDGLDADQQKAFESIMSQIEGGGSDDEDADPDESPPDPSEADATDDFSAELEKVVQEADAAENDPTGVEEVDDGLDADQQKAFESIMSQIEGGGSDDDEDADPDESPPDPSEADATDDFSAELEKVVQEADAAENGPAAVDEKDEEHLDADSLEVVDDIKSPIDVGDNPEAAEGLNPESVDTERKDPSQGQDVDSAGHANDKLDDEPRDISDDIDDILKEISSSEDEAYLPETADDQIVLQEAVSNGPVEETVTKISSPAGKKEKLDLSEGKPPTATASIHQAEDAKPSFPGLKAPITTDPLRETPASTGVGKKKIGLAVTVVILLLALAGYFYWGPKDRIEPTGPIPAKDTRVGEVVTQSDPVVKPVAPVVADFGPSDESRLKMAGDSLDHLRKEVIAKKNEIEELRAYYQAGIDAEIQGVMNMIRESGNGGMSFQSAMAEPNISLGMAAIQRRDTYIKKLVIPATALFRNSEELLFLSRRAELLTLMAGKTSDIDIDGFIQQAKDTSQAHRSTMDQLNIDEVPVSPLALESIWKDIAKRLSTTPVKRGLTQPTINTDNAKIWKDICDGDYSGKQKLTMLTPEAARCLATWKGKDLYLNEINELSPEAASQLAAWDGDWLGLNGLGELSPEVAVHLARWKGKVLSLNGLSRLSPRVVAILSEWQGEQIELVNVKHMAHWENPKTQLFLSEDLKRKRNAARN
jgi:hypothetical protein